MPTNHSVYYLDVTRFGNVPVKVCRISGGVYRHLSALFKDRKIFTGDLQNDLMCTIGIIKSYHFQVSELDIEECLQCVRSIESGVYFFYLFNINGTLLENICFNIEWTTRWSASGALKVAQFTIPAQFLTMGVSDAISQWRSCGGKRRLERNE